MPPVIERLTEGEATISEGPFWDARRQTLYYVDIYGKTLNRYKPSTKEHAKADLEKEAGFVLPVEGSDDKFVLGMQRELVIVTWDGVSATVSKTEVLAEIASEEVNTRFNDGKADASGRIWAGTTVPYSETGEPKNASLYSYCPKSKKLIKHLSNIFISNGLTWSPDSGKFYYIDSGTGGIDQFDYDLKNATLTNRQTLFTLKKHGLVGLCDGQTVDTDGNIWLANVMGSKIVKIDTKEPERILEVIEMPAKQVTSLTFGGANMDELYVTTGRVKLGDLELNPPVNGALYRITNTGARGLPSVEAKI